jgi:hypothetical membrane protein
MIIMRTHDHENYFAYKIRFELSYKIVFIFFNTLMNNQQFSFSKNNISDYVCKINYTFQFF